MKLLLEQPINGESSVYLLRSRLRAVSRRMGFKDTQREHMELVCNEIVTNQNKYAGGRGLVQLWEQPGACQRLHIFALDHGPGIANLPSALADGYTSSGTLGKGLGTIQRIADQCDFYTLPDGVSPRAPWHGLAVWAQFRAGDAAPAAAYQSGLYLRAYQDAVHNGDLMCTDTGDRHLARWLHLDGLGHGEEAAEGVSRACLAFDESATPCDALDLLSRRLKGTRGAVAIAGEIDFEHGHGRICGVGDMAAYLVGHSSRRSLSFAPGILGHSHRHFDAQSFELPHHAVMLTASDGIRKSWEAASFPGLWRTHPQLIAFFLGEVIGRSNDDKSIFAIRAHEQGDQDGQQPA